MPDHVRHLDRSPGAGCPAASCTSRCPREHGCTVRATPLTGGDGQAPCGRRWQGERRILYDASHTLRFGTPRAPTPWSTAQTRHGLPDEPAATSEIGASSLALAAMTPEARPVRVDEALCSATIRRKRALALAGARVARVDRIPACGPKGWIKGACLQRSPAEPGPDPICRRRTSADIAAASPLHPMTACSSQINYIYRYMV